jgi:hypothetical protein
MKKILFNLSPFAAGALVVWGIYSMTPPEKNYKVELPLSSWVKYSNGLSGVSQALRESDLPSRTVVFLTDSIINPILADISTQVNKQLTDTTNRKK